MSNQPDYRDEPFPIDYHPAGPPPPKDGKATASLVLGIISLITWLCPLVGFPIAIPGVILGSISLSGPLKGRAKVGLGLSITGLVLTLINSAVGAYMGATGQLKF